MAEQPRLPAQPLPGPGGSASGQVVNEWNYDHGNMNETVHGSSIGSE